MPAYAAFFYYGIRPKCIAAYHVPALCEFAIFLTKPKPATTKNDVTVNSEIHHDKSWNTPR